jgi:hypothetical protein
MRSKAPKPANLEIANFLNENSTVGFLFYFYTTELKK